MSHILRAMLAAKAGEADEIRRIATQLPLVSTPSSYDELDVGFPSLATRIDAVNLVPDPEGQGDRSSWVGEGGAVVGQVVEDLVGLSGAVALQPSGGAVGRLAAISRPAESARYASTTTAPVTLPADVPVGSTAGLKPAGVAYVGGQEITYTGLTATSLTGVSGGSGTWDTGTPVTDELLDAWCYAIVRSSVPFSAAVAPDFAPTLRFAGPLQPSVINEWVLVGGPLKVQASGKYRVLAESQAAMADGGSLAIAGATLAQGVDPQGPFSGATPAAGRYAYSWRGAAHGSPSQRHSGRYDLVSLREQEAGLDAAPQGMTIEQRRSFLLHWRQARNHASAQAFVGLILEMLRVDNPSTPDDAVVLRQNYENQSFSLFIDYSPTGLMAQRVSRLVELIQPAPLGLDAISYSGFRAGYGRAGEAI